MSRPQFGVGEGASADVFNRGKWTDRVSSRGQPAVGCFWSYVFGRDTNSSLQ